MKRCTSVVAALLALLAWSALAVGDPLHVETDSQKDWSTSPTPNADIADVEPNNSLATAQFVGCGNNFRPASLAAGVAPRDTDYVSFTATAGELLTIGTDADGAVGQAGDTRIRLFNASGVVLASDDDAGPGAYSLITGFAAPYTGTYYVGIAAFSTQTGGYRAFIICCPTTPPANDVCAGADQLFCGPIDLSGNTFCYTNNYTLPADTTLSCTNFSAAGRDLVYRLEVSGGDALAVTYTSTADGSIYLVTNCADPTNTCVAGADVTFSGQPEVLTYGFPASGTYYLILDSFGTNSTGSWTLTGSLDCTIVPVARKTWGAVKAIYR